MEPLQILGKNIRRLRLAKGFSQEEFALTADIDRSYVGQVERGRRNIAFENILKIARPLDVSVSQLVEGIR